MKLSCRFVVAVVLLSSAGGTRARAEFIAGFEADTIGTAPGSPVTSTTGNVTVQGASGFTGQTITPTEGGKFAYLTTGPGDRAGNDVGIPSGADRTGNGAQEVDVAVMVITFSTSQLSTLRFDWDVLTDEVTADGEPGNGIPDPFEVRLDGISLLKGAIFEDNGTFPAVMGFAGGTINGPDGSIFDDGRLGFQTFATTVAAGLHVLEFFVGDDSDGVESTDPYADTALLVDNVRLDAVPAPSTLALLAIGALTLAGFRLAAGRRREPGR